MRKALSIPLSLFAAGAAGLAYASVIERNWFRLRRFDLPILERGRRPLRILQISDLHLTPHRRMLIEWVRSLGALEPDLVINTGDSIAHMEAVPAFMHAVEPLLDRPGAFVYGSNDLYSPIPKNPVRYLWTSTKGYHLERHPDLPWEELGERMRTAGWLDLNNATGRIKTDDHDVFLGGVHDSHVDRDRYSVIEGDADASADLRLGIMHSPEPRNLDRFAGDGYDLMLAGHTHGGQICIPFYGALVTNCGIDPARAKGLHQWERSWLHVSAGLGTSPYAPVRFACAPEATLLTLLPRR